ncbi:MAG: nucleotidyltransferase [Terriglobia bacterium]
MFDDFKELLSIFNALSVKYLIVGGYAVSFHAQPRATKDIDLLIKPNAGNAKAVYAALSKFGTPLDGITVEDFSDRKKFFRIGREPVAVDILPEIDGIEFDDAWERRVEAVIDAESGLKVSFISNADLITSKLAAGRPQDIADVAAIRKAVESQPKAANETKEMQS